MLGRSLKIGVAEAAGGGQAGFGGKGQQSLRNLRQHFVGTVVIALICLLQVILTAVTKAHTPIHDLIAGTVTADYATQRIFESTDALVEYKRQLAAEEAARSEY